MRTLTDGGQPASETADELVAFLSAARRSLDLALYDVALSDALAARVRGALMDAKARGVAVRLVYNVDHAGPIPVPPPPSDGAFLRALDVPSRAISGVPDLMHHKYVVRDAATVWTGSTNWRDDAWTREENVIVVVDSAALARSFLDDFAQLWSTGSVERSGKVEPERTDVDGLNVRPWFAPGRSRGMVHRFAQALGHATRRIRIASPVLTAGPILGTLAEIATDGRVDLAGALDATQMRQVLAQWDAEGRSQWKRHGVETVVTRATFSGKLSTPWAPDRVHDYMHAKIVVADDTVFVGSYNLSHAGESNAENVLEIADAALADRLVAYVDLVRERYPRFSLRPV